MKPDLLICWHESCDYPIARLTLRRYRSFFGKIIIYFSKHFREHIYTDFLKNSMINLGNILFLDPIEYKYGVEDWRDISTNYMLKHSNSEWMCSVEQDFFSKDWDSLLKAVEQASYEADLIGWLNKTAHSYIHPAFWFIKKEVLEKTNKDFSPHSEIVGCDHFGMITYDVEKLGGKIVGLNIGDFGQNPLAFHLGGVNQNYLEGLKEGYVFHRPDWFYIYNYWSMKADIPQSPEFMELMKKIDVKLKLKFPDINPQTDSRAVYFK